jgi:NitT/TauT family transport system ATP-binding protein
VVLFSPHPGRIREEFQIDLPRPRDINSVELAEYSTDIRRVLKELLDSAATEAAK